MNLFQTNAAKSFVDIFLSLVYPDICQICGKRRATKSESYICRECCKDVKRIVSPVCKVCGRHFEGNITVEFTCEKCQNEKTYYNIARSAVKYNGTILKALCAYKYNRAMWFEPFLASMLIEKAKEEIDAENWDCIVPVPLHFARKNERGFNQAERLSLRLSQALNIPMNVSILKRVKYTETQTALERRKRGENVKNAFTLKKKSLNINNLRVILVDDVMTTGATVNECAKTLRKGGASAVFVLTLARA
ncbi:MAG: ComF family protein [Verrucomicrobiae bacterium]|nr:ComF family protein [Verrucomicrobiae bacterium]